MIKKNHKDKNCHNTLNKEILFRQSLLRQNDKMKKNFKNFIWESSKSKEWFIICFVQIVWSDASNKNYFIAKYNKAIMKKWKEIATTRKIISTTPHWKVVGLSKVSETQWYYLLTNYKCLEGPRIFHISLDFHSDAHVLIHVKFGSSSKYRAILYWDQLLILHLSKKDLENFIIYINSIIQQWNS